MICPNWDADDEVGRNITRSLAEQPLPDDQKRWESLIAELDVDWLTNTVISRVVNSEITGPLRSTDDFRRSVRLALQTIIESLRTRAFAIPVAEPAANEAIRSPGAGMAAEELVSGHYLSALWEGLVGAATPDDAELLIRHTPELFTIVERTCHAQALRWSHCRQSR